MRRRAHRGQGSKAAEALRQHRRRAEEGEPERLGVRVLGVATEDVADSIVEVRWADTGVWTVVSLAEIDSPIRRLLEEPELQA